MDSGVLSALVPAAAGLAGGLVAPGLITRIPEPVPDGLDHPEEAETAENDAVLDAAEPEPDPEPGKELYRDIAALPGLRWWLALAGVVCGGLIGARLGWHGGLLPWAYLVPLGLVLTVVDARTRLLPTWLIAPSYAVLIALLLLAALWDQQTGHLVGALLGWAALGGCYFLLWLVYPRGMGYGDVRLSGLLGLALGYLGWEQVLVGAYAGILLGGFGGVLLKAVRLVRGSTVPFGPFMVVGGFVGAALGRQIMAGLGY